MDSTRDLLNLIPRDVAVFRQPKQIGTLLNDVSYSLRKLCNRCIVLQSQITNTNKAVSKLKEILKRSSQEETVTDFTFDVDNIPFPALRQYSKKMKRLPTKYLAIANTGRRQCGICLLQLPKNTSSIGILSNCSHVFCFDCIREWSDIRGVTENGWRRFVII